MGGVSIYWSRGAAHAAHLLAVCSAKSATFFEVKLDACFGCLRAFVFILTLESNSFF